MAISGVPLDTVVLTRRGWLRHDEITVGDETLGFDWMSRCARWTPVLRIARVREATVLRIGNSHWQARVTADFHWLSDTRVKRRPESLGCCPECGWTGSPRGVSTHRGRMHPAPGPRRRAPHTTVIETTEFVRTEDLGHTHRIRTAAEATSSSGIAISPTEAAILGWLLGDGNIRHDPITGRWDGCIYQSKPPMVEKLRALLRDIPHGEGVRDRGGNTQWPEHSFRLRRAFVTDLLARARLNVLAPELERWVIDLDREQRTAWLSALIDAEGHTRDGFTRITQVDGDLQNAIRLAVFLSGARPTYSRLRAQERGYRPSGNAGMARPHVAPSMFHARQELAPQPVWWMETVSGSWTIRQGHLITLAGAGNAASLRGDRHRPVSAGRPPRPAG